MPRLAIAPLKAGYMTTPRKYAALSSGGVGFM